MLDKIEFELTKMKCNLYENDINERLHSKLRLKILKTIGELKNYNSLPTDVKEFNPLIESKEEFSVDYLDSAINHVRSIREQTKYT